MSHARLSRSRRERDKDELRMENMAMIFTNAASA